MAQERLYITNVWIPLTAGLNPSITKSITDITEPQSRKSTYTKTVSIPRSKEADKIFSHIFEFNAIDLTFNPANRAAVRYECDSEIILEGYIRLNKIGRTNNNEITYDCTMFSKTADFMSTIGGAYLTDLYESTAGYEGLDVYDHPLTKELQEWSWDNQIIKNYPTLIPFAFGTGYVYALVDYGFSQDATNFIYTQIGCSIYEKEYLTKIISWAGYTLQSGGWVDTDDVINHLIIPSSPEVYQLTSADIALREFAANTPLLTSTGTTTSNNLPIGSFSTPDVIQFSNEIFDTGLNYNPANGKFTVVSTGVYDLNTLIDVNATFTPTTGAAVKTVCDIHGFIQVWHTPYLGAATLVSSLPIYITSDDAAFTIGARSTSTTPTYPDTDYMSGKAWGKLLQTTPAARNVNPPDRYQLSVLGAPLMTGDVIEIKWKAGIYATSTSSFAYVSSDDLFVDSGGAYYTGNATLSIAVGSFFNKVANNTMTEGNTLQMLDVIPKNVKMSDYISSLLRRFNLILDANIDNPKELILKQSDAYYGTDVINIHKKIDRKKVIESYPMATLDIKKYYYSYKPDADYWNARYTQSWQQVYGDRQVDVLSEFAKAEKKTEIIFSPTCMVGIAGNNRVLPTIYAVDDNNQPKTTKHNIRSLYYAGLKPCLNAWGHTNYVSVFGIPLTDYYTEYPYAGHWDDPYTPTLDINFGLVNEVFYDDDTDYTIPITATDNNLVNKYHAKDIRQLTDPDSRIVKCHVHIRPLDFVNFTFDKLYEWDYAFWRLQEITNYNPASHETTECTFLKLVSVPDFTPNGFPATGSPDLVDPDQTGGDVDMTEATPVKGTRSYDQPDNNNYLSKSVVVQGDFNYVSHMAKNVEIYGDSNKVFAEAKNIKIQGDSNIIEAGVENVTLINTSGLTITESDVTYIDGKKQNYWEEKTAGFVVDDTVYGYFLDGSTSGIQVRLNNSTSEFVFKCTDGTNRVYLDGGAITIDNTAVTFDLLENESVRIKYNAQDNTYYIIN